MPVFPRFSHLITLSKTLKTEPLKKRTVKKTFGEIDMDERIARLRTHQKNIDRYQGLLKTKLSEAEQKYLEKRVSEERFAIAMLEFMSPSAPPRDMTLPGPEQV